MLSLILVRRSLGTLGFLLLLLPVTAHAATRTIANGGGNYNSTSTWVEGVVPTSSDDVVATVTSGQLTVNVASAAKSIDFTNYTNTLTMNALLTVSGNVTLVNTMTIAGSSTLKVVTTSTLNFNGETWPNGLQLTCVGNCTSTFTLSSTITVLGTLTLNGSDSNSSSVVVNGNTINVNGGLTMANGGNCGGGSSGTTNIVLNGTGTWSSPNTCVTSNNSILSNPLTINTSGTITISGTDYYAGTFTYTAGTVVTTGSTFVFWNQSSTLPASITWNNLTLGRNGNGSTTLTLASDVTVLGNLTIQDENSSSITLNGNTINVGGNLFVENSGSCGGGVSGTTNIVLNGTGTWSQSNCGSYALRNSVTINTSGTITISGTVSYNTGILTYTAGTVVTTSSTLIVGAAATLNTNGMSWNNVSFTGGNTVTYTLSSNLTVGGTLSVTTGNGITTLSGSTIFVGGSMTSPANVGAITGTTNIVLNGTGTWSQANGTSGYQNNVTINTPGTITISGTVGCGNLTYVAGTVVTTNSTLIVGKAGNLPTGIVWNNLTLNAGAGAIYSLMSDITINGTLSVTTGNATATINGSTIYVGGGLTSPANVGAITGTTNIVLNGTGTWSQANAAPNGYRNNITINTAGTITVSGNVGYGAGTLTYVAGTVVVAGSTLSIGASATLNTAGIAWNNVALSGTSTDTLASSLTVNGTLTIGGSTTLAGSGGLILGTNSVWSGSSSMSLSGSLTLGSSMTNSYTGPITFSATSGTKTITTNGVTLASNITFNGVGGTFRLADNLATGSANTVTLTNGTFDANGKNLTTGLFASSNANIRTLTMGAGTWMLTGNNATIWNTGTDTNLTINLGNAVVCNYSGSTGTRTIMTAATESKAPSFNVTAGSDTVAIGTAVGSINFTGFAGTLSNAARTVYGNWTVAAGMTLSAGGGVTTFAATSGTKSLASNGKTLDFPLTFNGTGGTFQLADALAVGSTRTITVSAGTFTPSSLPVTAGALTVNGGTFTGSSGPVNLSGSLTLSSGTLTAPTGTLTLWGDWLKIGGTFARNGGTVVFGGPNTQTLTAGGTDGGSSFAILTVSKSAGTLSLATNALSGAAINVTAGTLSPGSLDLTTTSLTVNGGTFTGSTGLVTISGNLLLSSGTFTAPSGTMSLAGNFTRSASTFNANNGAVNLGTSSQTLSGALTFYDLTKAVSAAATLSVAPGPALRITHHLSLSGLLTLASTVQGLPWTISSETDRSFEHLTVQDSTNIDGPGGHVIHCVDCHDGGGNSGWDFSVSPVLSSTGSSGTSHGGGGGGGRGRTVPEPSTSTATSPTPLPQSAATKLSPVSHARLKALQRRAATIQHQVAQAKDSQKKQLQRLLDRLLTAINALTGGK